MASIQEVYQLIECCESRLSQQDLQQEEDNPDYAVFPPNARVLYHQLLGDAYLKVFIYEGENKQPNEPLTETQKEYGKRSISVLEVGMKIAADYLQIVDRKSF